MLRYNCQTNIKKYNMELIIFQQKQNLTKQQSSNLMNQPITMRKQLLKEALSKTNNNKKDLIAKQVKQSNHTSSQLKSLQTTESLYFTPNSTFPVKLAKKPSKNQPITGNILNDLRMSRDQSIAEKSQNESYFSSELTEKPSTRSVFSELLYTQQTDNVKEMVRKLFLKKNFIKQIEQEINSYALGNFKKCELEEILNKLLSNQIFILSLQIRIKETNQKQKEQIVQKEVMKKITHHLEFAQNERACHAAETRIQRFLQQKLRKIRRKQL